MAGMDARRSYDAHVTRLKHGLEQNEALRDAIGGDFIAVGMLEYSLLRSLGLESGQLVIDVGCGSGRLAYQLSPMRDLRYVGVDLVRSLLDYAQRVAARPDWSFQVTAHNKI